MVPNPRVLAAVVVLMLSSIGALGAQNSVSVSGNPALMRVNSAVPGSEPTAVTDAVTTYTVTTGGIKKITGRLMAALPAGVSLTVTLAAPPGATSMGPVTLTLTEADLVINIPAGTNSTRSITYRLDATVAAGVVPVSTRTVRLRIRNYP